MSRPTYAPVLSFTGTGSVATFNFAFKIEELAQLLLVEYDTAGAETQRVDGTDVTYISSVTFDAEAGGGSVTLAANLTTGYTLKVMLANDSPTQPFEMRSKFSFSLKAIENAFDRVLGPVQRLAYLAQRSVKLPDYLDLANFDPTLPIEVTDTTSRTIVTTAAGTGFKIGPTATEIANAQSYALAAAASASAAAASETAAAASASAAASSASAAAASETAAAASAADAAASVATLWTEHEPHAFTAGQAATDLTGETADGTVYTSVMYEYEVIRGTTIFANGRFVMQYLNSAWRLVDDGYAANEVHGLTFSFTEAAGVFQLRLAVNAGSNGNVKLSRRTIAA